MIEVSRVKGSLPFSNHIAVFHLFLRWRNFNLHIVVFHQIKHFLWIGKISELQLRQLKGFNVHFGIHEAIYDPFGLNRIDSVQFPGEIGHFLGQIPTSKYLHCPPARQYWLAENNLPISEEKIVSSEEAIIGTKSLMKELRMQSWIACGTLLGWHRQCHVTPYTSDTDFATWAKYLQGKSITKQLKELAPKHNLYLHYRFGEPMHSMEFSFLSKAFNERVDMFFIYPNQTHFLLPYHIVDKNAYAYSIYPKYDLCSVELLGYKLLAPCEPEKVILPGKCCSYT